MNARRHLASQVAVVVAATPRTLGEALVQIGVVVSAWPRLSAHERKQVRTAAERLAGLRERRTDRTTRRTLGVYDAESGLVDVDCLAEGERYTVVCEEHSTLVCVSSLREARSTGCLDFCDECREEGSR